MKFLIYLFPALMDMIVASVMFTCPQLLAELGASARDVTNLFVAWGVVYALLCPLVGRLTNARNAAWLAISSSLLMGVCAFSFALLPSLWPMYATMMVLSCATAFFFTPFQVFMKAVHGHHARDLAHSVGLYTFAWCAGFACGPFVAAWVWNSAGWRACHGFNGLLSLMTAAGLLLMRHYAHTDRTRADKDSRTPPPVPSENELGAKPNLAWLGWTASGAALLVMALTRSVLPLSGMALDITRAEVGAVLTIIFLAASLAGLGLAHSRTWM
ncbi:MAG: MFS transporter [Planctomycetes bacterium]|nr:MFS transporter [Planctomycetota bacterium]